MKRHPSPSIVLLKSHFFYDPMIGEFRHNKRRHGAKHGAIAGRLDKDGYRVIKMNGLEYRAHHCAWLWVYGEWVDGELDHKNGQAGDNRIKNLRKATRSQNRANSKVPRGSASGLKGAIRQISGQKTIKWQSRIMKDGKLIYLGLFNDPEDAHSAYVAAAKRMFGEFACDGIREI